ncbi:uncharacterized protein LOC133391329 [Anopheles gambiae]|uniref:uncharacterized protein LOC133391329 n=1 Tax=Anopheles gambiae TaxID=7165 RepID=UPI002AC9C98C|nr:uncharacterized protein LOC133391329 [Anopheles gambiae]
MTHSVLSLPVASVLLVCACLFVPFVRTIEVHEDVNEGPTIGAHLRAVNASIPHTNATAGPPVVERNVNDLPPPSAPPLLHRPREQIATANASPTASEPSAGEQPPLVANNFTAFPSNHKQHSGASTVHGQTSSPLTTEVVAIAGITSVLSPATPTPPVAAAVGGLSSFRAANGRLYPARGTSSIVNDRTVQHQISSYRKRQLYASAAPRRNVTGSSSEGQFTKEFVPSPEVVPFFNEDNSAPGSPAAGTVDAPYPTGHSDADSRWYAGGIGLSGHGAYAKAAPGGGGGSSEESGRWEHKYGWTTPQTHQRHQPTVQIKFPQDPTPHFPTPKGKWKWIPEEEEETESAQAAKAERPRPAETPFSSPLGSFEEQHSGRPQFAYPVPTTAKSHPYSFDRSPLEGTFSIEPVLIANHSSAGGGVGGGSSTGGSAPGTESNEAAGGIGGTTDVKLAGKEDAHLKGVSPWKKIIHVLSAAIPIGLLISALTPQVVYINPNATQPPIQLQTPTPVGGSALSSTPTRQRSLGQDVPRFLLAQRGLGADPDALVRLLRKLNALEQRETLAHDNDDGKGTNRLSDSSATRLQGCDWKLLCQLARQGMSGMGTDALHKTLWKIVSETSPSEWQAADGLGLDETFRLIRDGDCDRLQRTCDQDT